VVGVRGGVREQGRQVEVELAGGFTVAAAAKVGVYGGEVKGEYVVFVKLTINDPAVSDAETAKRLLEDPEAGADIRCQVMAIKQAVLARTDRQLKAMGLDRKTVEGVDRIEFRRIADRSKRPEVKRKLRAAAAKSE
jgi:hypothetical protein